MFSFVRNCHSFSKMVVHFTMAPKIYMRIPGALMTTSDVTSFSFSLSGKCIVVF